MRGKLCLGKFMSVCTKESLPQIMNIFISKLAKRGERVAIEKEKQTKLKL